MDKEVGHSSGFKYNKNNRWVSFCKDVDKNVMAIPIFS